MWPPGTCTLEACRLIGNQQQARGSMKTQILQRYAEPSRILGLYSTGVVGGKKLPEQLRNLVPE